ncbi:Adenylate cyclase type 2 [Folsomia candida]|uniref:Adenylate cyclase type 2 n=1 Tax=Folsomia candida TaxID=158441 RepID=A0A226EVF0_FOLCA|nr:Adenylate cyclase type 2 [Folsomia candida]
MGKDETDLDSVYVTYWERLQHSLFLSFLLAAICATTTFLILAFAVGHNVVNTTPQVSLLITTLVILLVIFLVSQFPIFQKRHFSVSLSLLVISSLTAAVFISTHISAPTRPGDCTVPIFILVFAINTMMPLPRWVAIAASIVLAVVHLLLAVLLSNDFVDSLAAQVFAIAIFHLSALLGGIYHHEMAVIAHKRTCQGTKTCLESRVKLEHEKEQQEQLLLSVIPAYIAAEASKQSDHTIYNNDIIRACYDYLLK